MSRIPEFLEALDRIRSLHIKKNEDYASSTDPFSNFNFTEFVLSHFSKERDKVFAWPIANKLSRLANLLSNDNNPNNESIEDSLEDCAVYFLLWSVDVKRRFTSQSENKSEHPSHSQKEDQGQELNLDLLSRDHKDPQLP